MAEPFLGEIRYFGFNFAPRGWAFCNGQLLAISSNTALFSLLGTIYGGDGRTTFALPDLRGRVPLHFGAGPGLTNYIQGSRGGAEQVTLNSSQIPAHSHPLNGVDAEDRNTNRPGGALPGKGGNYHDGTGPPTLAAMDGAAIGNTGGNGAHENRPPYLVINACIAVQGLFPSRN